jgi:hypothetical protein
MIGWSFSTNMYIDLKVFSNNGMHRVDKSFCFIQLSNLLQIRHFNKNKIKINVDWGENTLHLPKIVVTKTKILHLVFFGSCGHHILDYFYSFQVYCINFRFKLAYLKRKSNKHLQT